MEGAERTKRETRKAYVDYIPEGRGIVVLFVFRGGWIDAIVMKRGAKDLEDLVKWLRETGYFEEISGIAFGEGFRSAIGWKMNEKYLGIPLMDVPPRNRRDAEVVIEGIRKWLGEKVEERTDKLKSSTKV
ncbi:MAG: hypothetical protein H5T34_03095 [Candidatus Methanomethyliales bacterium]|nr:hypothetical protein [Candidatus Methanomethylicales archaeon]